MMKPSILNYFQTKDVFVDDDIKAKLELQLREQREKVSRNMANMVGLENTSLIYTNGRVVQRVGRSLDIS